MTGQDALPIAEAGARWAAGAEVYTRPDGIPYVSPPLALPLAWLVSMSGDPVLAFQLIGLGAAARGFYLAWQVADRRAVLLAALCAVPDLIVCWRTGQTAPLLVWAFAACLRSDRDVEAGAALAIAGAFKAWPLLLVVALPWRARWACLAFVVALSLVAGLPLWVDWFHHAQWVRETSSMHPGNAAPVAWLGWPAWAAGSGVILYALHHMRLPVNACSGNRRAHATAS